MKLKIRIEKMVQEKSSKGGSEEETPKKPNEPSSENTESSTQTMSSHTPLSQNTPPFVPITPKKLNFQEHKRNYVLYESLNKLHQNKFDINCPSTSPTKKGPEGNLSYKDNTNESLSNEEYNEKLIFYYNRNINKKNKGNDNNYQNSKTNKNKVPFVGRASDFKTKYKTELCKYFVAGVPCIHGDQCAYAHGTDDLRSKVTNSSSYRTKKCSQFFDEGFCPYGGRCQFRHEVLSNIINNPYDKSYENMIKTLSKLENVGNIKELVERPRLEVFNDNLENEEEKFIVKRNLLDDIKKINKDNVFERVIEDEKEEEDNDKQKTEE